MTRAAIYARYSSHSQREESIEDQVRVCREEAGRAGDEVVAVYSDSAMTGTNDVRPGFRRMLSAGVRGEFEVLYIYKQDRFARNRYDAATNKAKLRKAGVRIVSVAERIPDGAEGVLMESLLEGLAEYYSANLSENIRRGMEGNAMRCMTNGRPLYGYRTGADGRYEVDPETGPIARRVFELYAGGASMMAAAREAGMRRGARGGEIKTPFVSKMLRREQYVGTYSFMGVRVEGGMPALVDEETWRRVQERLASGKKHSRYGEEAYPLSGKLRTWDGRSLVGSSARNSKGHTYRYYRDPKTGYSVPKDEVEDRVAAGVLSRLGEAGARQRVADLVMLALEEEGSAARADIESLERELADNEREQEAIVDAALKMGPTEAMGRRAREAEARHAEIVAELAEARRGLPDVTREMVEFWLDGLVEAPDLRDLAAGFVSRVTISEDGGIFVEFNLLRESVASGAGDVFARVSYGPDATGSTKNEHPNSELGCSHVFPMVDSQNHSTNTAPQVTSRNYFGRGGFYAARYGFGFWVA